MLFNIAERRTHKVRGVWNSKRSSRVVCLWMVPGLRDVNAVEYVAVAADVVTRRWLSAWLNAAKGDVHEDCHWSQIF
jgi:hypothetical protein